MSVTAAPITSPSTTVAFERSTSPREASSQPRATAPSPDLDRLARRYEAQLEQLELLAARRAERHAEVARQLGDLVARLHRQTVALAQVEHAQVTA